MNRDEKVQFVVSEVLGLLEDHAPGVASKMLAQREEAKVREVQKILQSVGRTATKTLGERPINSIQTAWLKKAVGDELANEILNRAKSVEAPRGPGAAFLDQLKAIRPAPTATKSLPTTGPAGAFLAQLERGEVVRG